MDDIGGKLGNGLTNNGQSCWPVILLSSLVYLVAVDVVVFHSMWLCFTLCGGCGCVLLYVVDVVVFYSMWWMCFIVCKNNLKL